jgi:hypothetical protein
VCSVLTDLGTGNDSTGQSVCPVVQKNAAATMVACEHEGATIRMQDLANLGQIWPEACEE